MGVCFSGNLAEKGASMLINKIQGDGDGADGGSEAGGAEDAGKGGLDFGSILKGDEGQKDGGTRLTPILVTTFEDSVCQW